MFIIIIIFFFLNFSVFFKDAPVVIACIETERKSEITEFLNRLNWDNKIIKMASDGINNIEQLLRSLKARELLEELQRSLGSGNSIASARVLPPFDAVCVSQTASCIHAMQKGIIETSA